MALATVPTSDKEDLLGPLNTEPLWIDLLDGPASEDTGGEIHADHRATVVTPAAASQPLSINVVRKLLKVVALRRPRARSASAQE